MNAAKGASRGAGSCKVPIVAFARVTGGMIIAEVVPTCDNLSSCGFAKTKLRGNSVTYSLKFNRRRAPPHGSMPSPRLRMAAMRSVLARVGDVLIAVALIFL